MTPLAGSRLPRVMPNITNALNQRTLTSLYGFMRRWYGYDERGHLTGSYALSVGGYF